MSFELVGLALGETNHTGGKVGEFRDLDTIALVARAWLHFVQQRNVLIIDVRNDVQVLDATLLLCQGRKLVKVRRKDALTANLRHNILGNGPGESKAIVRRRAATELINEHERLGGCTLEDRGRLEHFSHECADAS